MTKIKDNIDNMGLSGMLGKQIVFRQWQGATIVSKAPTANHSLRKREMYEKNKPRLIKAAAYGKKVMNDPELKLAYKSKCNPRQNAYNRAVKDFLTAPEITEIDLSNYTGEADSFIRICAVDDFKVKQIRVQIEDKNGNGIESGFALQEDDTDYWRFVVAVPHLFPEGGKVIVTAFDLPGNETTRIEHQLQYPEDTA